MINIHLPIYLAFLLFFVCINANKESLFITVENNIKEQTTIWIFYNM